MIKPTVGRMILFIPNTADARNFGASEGQELAAVVAAVWSNTLINVSVCDVNGVWHGRKHVVVEHDDHVAPPHGASFCRWMAYQTGQAAKTEKLQAQLDSKIQPAGGMNHC